MKHLNLIHSLILVVIICLLIILLWYKTIGSGNFIYLYVTKNPVIELRGGQAQLNDYLQWMSSPKQDIKKEKEETVEHKKRISRLTELEEAEKLAGRMFLQIQEFSLPTPLTMKFSLVYKGEKCTVYQRRLKKDSDWMLDTVDCEDLSQISEKTEIKEKTATRSSEKPADKRMSVPDYLTKISPGDSEDCIELKKMFKGSDFNAGDIAVLKKVCSME